jgi:hypothetical protein
MNSSDESFKLAYKLVAFVGSLSFANELSPYTAEELVKIILSIRFSYFKHIDTNSDKISNEYLA